MLRDFIGRFVNRLTPLVLGLLVLLPACSQNKKQTPTVENESKKDITNQLATDADQDAIVDHLLLARKDESTTRALAIHFPELDRAQAYQIEATGTTSIMMSGAPLDAVLALANELPKYGRYLRAGDVVIIGSMLESPPAVAGDHVQIIFSSFGTLDLTLE